MKWYDDPIFTQTINTNHEDIKISDIATPAFRLSIQSSHHLGHPFDFVEEYNELFNLFRPILKRDAERLHMVEVAGGKARRRKKILESDWEPFEFLAKTVALTGGTEIGFDFQCGHSDSENDHERFDIGPTRCLLHITMKNTKFDITIPVKDFEEGAIDVDALKKALLKLPVSCAVAGYGMCVGGGPYNTPITLRLLTYPAKKYPVLDLCLSTKRDWSFSHENFTQYLLNEDKTDVVPFVTPMTWIIGINWLTLIGEPFLSRTICPDSLLNTPNDQIEAIQGNNTVLYQLGDRPITGEKGVDDDLLPLYFELGNLLQPSQEWQLADDRLYQDPFGFATHGLIELDASLDWSRRFFNKKWFEGNIDEKYPLKTVQIKKGRK